MHKGVPALAYEMIRQFSQAGATIIKFQFGWTKEAQLKFGLEYNPIRFIDPIAQDLRRWCDLYNVELMASIWSEEGLETARLVRMSHYKIAHRVWKDDQELSQKIIDEGHTCLVSGTPPLPGRCLPLYCVSKYPTYPGEINMPEHFGYYYGYSDHSHGIAAPLLAVARGAEYIEKHVCLDKTDLATKDTPFSATPDEFATMVRIGNEMRHHLEAHD